MSVKWDVLGACVWIGLAGCAEDGDAGRRSIGIDSIHVDDTAWPNQPGLGVGKSTKRPDGGADAGAMDAAMDGGGAVARDAALDAGPDAGRDGSTLGQLDGAMRSSGVDAEVVAPRGL